MTTTDTGLVAGRPLLGGILGAGWSQASGAVTTGLHNFDTWWSSAGVSHTSEVTTMYVGGSLTTSSVTAYTASLAGYTGHVIWSVPGFPSTDSSPTYAKLLAGNYDSNFAQVFQAIAAATPNATARPFWELEGNWFSWGQGLRSSNGYTDATFAQAWDHVWAIGQPICPTLTWEFNGRLYNGWNPANIPLTAGHVDVVGADQYSMGTLSSQTQQSAWQANDLPCYTAAINLAKKLGARFGLSEVATGYRSDGTSMGDDDYWLTQLAQLIKGTDTAYFAYFNDNDPTGGGTSITNRFQMAVPATLYQPSTFSTSSYFPKTAAVWQGQTYTPANLTYAPSTTAIAPVPRTRKRTARWYFNDAAQATVSPYITASGTQLLNGNTRYLATGWDSYVMRSAGGTSAQTMTATQVDAFFSGLAAGSLVRVWAFMPAAGTYTNAQVFTEQDQIVTSAKKYGHRLVFTLADWAGNANDGTGAKTVSWLTGKTYTGAYQTWVGTIVPRYASEPTVVAWDLLNEPLAPSNSADLKTFVDTVGAQIAQLAPNQLVMLGCSNPAAACGSTANYQTVMASTYIDIVSFHDYYEVPGIDDKFLAVNSVARALGKPMLVDEVGVWASTSAPYTSATKSPGGYTAVSYANQANILQEKFRLYAGYPEVAAFCVWSEMEAGINDPAFESPAGSADRTTVHSFSMLTGGVSFTPSTVANLEGWVKSVDAWRIADGTTTGATMYRRGTANTYSCGFTATHSAWNSHPGWSNTTAATWLDWSAVEPAQTWFLVVRPTTLTAGTKHYLIGADNGSGGLAVYIDGSTGKLNVLNEGQTPFGVGTTTLATNTTYLIEVHCNVTAGTWSTRVNGAVDASGSMTFGTVAASSNTSLLRQFTWQSGNAFVGYLFEAVKFSTDLGTADSGTVRSYLLAEYGLTAGSGSSNPRDSLTITSGRQIDGTNTGYSASLLQGSLTTVGTAASPVDTTITTAGTTIRDTEYHGMVTVNAANVTFKNCTFHGRNSTVNEACVMATGSAVSNLYIEDCTFLPDHPSVWVNGINGHDFTLNRCNISSTVDGCGVFNTNAAQPYASGVKIYRTYIHDLAYFTPDPNHATDNQTHNDGVQIQGGTGTVIQYSNIQSYYGQAGSGQPTPNTSPSPSGYASVALSCVMFNVNVGSTTGAVITDNCFGGGYIPINCAGGPSSLGTIERNQFDGGSLVMSSGTAKPQTITMSSTQSATTGDGTADANTFYAGSFNGQEVLVRHNG